MPQGLPSAEPATELSAPRSLSWLKVPQLQGPEGREGRARWNEPAIMTSISPKEGSPRSVRKRFTSPAMQLSSVVLGRTCHFSASSTMNVHSKEGGDRVIAHPPRGGEVTTVFLPKPENCRTL